MCPEVPVQRWDPHGEHGASPALTLYICTWKTWAWFPAGSLTPWEGEVRGEEGGKALALLNSNPFGQTKLWWGPAGEAGRQKGKVQLWSHQGDPRGEPGVGHHAKRERGGECPAWKQSKCWFLFYLLHASNCPFTKPPTYSSLMTSTKIAIFS